MENKEENTDNILHMVARQADGIEELLNIFFGFLQRRTDFYAKEICEEENVENKKKNYPCKELLLKYYEKYRIIAKKKMEEVKKENKIRDEERKKRILEEKNKNNLDLNNVPKIEEIFEDEEKEKNNKNMNKNEVSISTENKKIIEDKKIKEDKKLIKDKKDFDYEEEKKEESESEAPLGNGGKTDKYVWSQTLGAVEVMIPVQPKTKSSDCIVKIQKQHLKVGMKNKPLIIDGKLNSAVKAEDCMWTLVDNMIQINLEKIDNMKWWDCVIIGDPTIDTKKIVPENSKLGDLDGETRATVEKMMIEMRQKSLGLPTAEQQKQADIFNKFKNAHPEFDFSQAKVNWGSSNNQFQL